MPWFKVDDSFYDHPKVFDAPDCAVALWVRAGTWSARNLTDGFVPARMPARLCDDPDVAVRELIARGLWSRSKGGYQFHDWSVYQPTRSEAIAARDRMAPGGALGNHRRWHVDKGKTDPDCRYCQAKQDRGTDRVPDRVGDGVPESPPNPPVPSRPVPRGTGGGLAHGGTHARDDPPPERCPQHIGDPDPPRCGACADARRRHQQWQADQARAAQARRSAQARRRAELRAAEIAACTRCDTDGRLPSGAVCRHTPTSTTGAAAARAALTRKEPQ